jgi:hypothetical protein
MPLNFLFNLVLAKVLIAIFTLLQVVLMLTVVIFYIIYFTRLDTLSLCLY